MDFYGFYGFSEIFMDYHCFGMEFNGFPRSKTTLGSPWRHPVVHLGGFWAPWDLVGVSLRVPEVKTIEKPKFFMDFEGILSVPGDPAGDPWGSPRDLLGTSRVSLEILQGGFWGPWVPVGCP